MILVCHEKTMLGECQFSYFVKLHFDHGMESYTLKNFHHMIKDHASMIFNVIFFDYPINHTMGNHTRYDNSY